MKCDNCKNKDICKHVEYMQSVEDKVKDLDLNKGISIRVDIKCGYMQEKNCEGGINHNNIFSTKLYDFKKPSYFGNY